MQHRWLSKRLKLESAVVAAARQWAKPTPHYRVLPDGATEDVDWYQQAEEIEGVLVKAIDALERHVDRYGER